MKKLLFLFPLILVFSSCDKKATGSSGAGFTVPGYTGTNKLLGIGRIGNTAYHCTVNPEKVAATGKWNFGAEEPPLGPNKAMMIAQKALEDNFREIATFKSDVITLIRFREGAVYQAIFTTPAERAIGERSDLTTHMYIYVYMDGSTEVPVAATTAPSAK